MSVAFKPTRREEIVAAAGELFSRHGFHGTSMRDLAKRIDLRGSSLYAHFASKDDLLWAIIDGAANAFVSAADSVPEGQGPTARLSGLIEAHLRVIGSELPYATVFFNDWSHLSDERKQRLIVMRDDYQRRFTDVIAEGVALGEFGDVDVDLATLVVLSALNYSYQWLDPAGRLEHEELAAAFAGQLIGGLRDPQAHTAAAPAITGGAR